MDQVYRITPKKYGKKTKWIVQRCVDRKQIGKSFGLKSDANAEHLKLVGGIALKNKASNNNVLNGNGKTFIEAFKEFADWKKTQSTDTSRFTNHSANRYDQEYRLRIAKYMDPKVLLSDFNLLDMEDFLKAAHDDKVPFKTLRKSVKDIKHFLKRQEAIGNEPCLKMLKFNILDYHYVVPKDDDLLFKKEIELIDDRKIIEIISEYYKNLWKDVDAANTFAIFSMLFLFGLRASELSGIKRSAIDFEKSLLRIKGVYIPAEGGFLNRTKNRGSKRPIPIDDDAKKFLSVWLLYLEKNYKHSIWLFPSMKGDGPLGYKYINAHVWKAYAKMGLAEINVRKDGHVKIISSPLKYFPTKIFRHRLCTNLISAMKKHTELDEYQVKTIAGHLQFKTTDEIYGNKEVRGTPEERVALAKAKEKATKANLLTQVISQK